MCHSHIFLKYNIEELEAPAVKVDFEAALSKIQSSVSQADLKKYQDWMDEFGNFFNVVFY